MAAAWDRLLCQEIAAEAKEEVPEKPAKPTATARRTKQGFDDTGVPDNPYKHEARKPILAKPLTKEEQVRIGLLYRKNVALVKYMTQRMNSKYGGIVETDTIQSLAQVAFLKASRTWDREKGSFSTIYAVFFNGEILHWIRGSNWGYKAEHTMRGLGCKVRSLMNKGLSTAEILEKLEITAEKLKEALLATNGVDHDIKGFDLHFSPYKTPMEEAEDDEEIEAMRERLIALSAKKFGLTEAQAQAFVKQKLMQVEIFGFC